MGTESEEKMRLRVAFAVVLLLGMGGSTVFAGAAFTSLGAGTTATGITSDGRVVAYHSSTNAYIWSAAHGAQSLGAGSTAGIASKGSTVVVAGIVNGIASRWDSSTASWTALPLAGKAYNWTPLCIGANPGDVYIGGYSTHGSPSQKYACRYKESTASTSDVQLPSGSYHNNSQINGTSSSAPSTSYLLAGQAKYGGSGPPEGGSRQPMGGVNPDGGVALLGFNTLRGAPSTSYDAVASAISADGTRIAGWTSVGGAMVCQACYWDSPYSTGQTPTAIPGLSGYYWARTTAVSPDGSIICGFTWNTDDVHQTAFIWDAVNGTRDLAAVFAAAGLDMTGWELSADPFAVSGISADGKCFCGTGAYNGVQSAWVATLPGPVGMTNKAAHDTIMKTASQKQPVVLWGKVLDDTYYGPTSFTLDDGSNAPVGVISSSGHGVWPGCYVRAKGLLDATVSPPVLYSSMAEITILAY